jgi:hypothetical protein
MSAAVVCTSCKRGRESCMYCEGTKDRDWAAICDCGLYDFGAHLVDCGSRSGFLYVIAADHASAAETL